MRLHNNYDLHRVVYSLFENTRAHTPNSQESSGFLYADKGFVDQYRRILLLSNRSPRSRVSDRYGQVLSKEIAPTFLNHDRYQFEVIANPVKDTKSGRKPLRDAAAIQDWFESRAPRWGFALQPGTFASSTPEVMRITTPSGHQLVVSKSIISGQLRVLDRAFFTQAFTSGIGRARAFGCGLLQIKPILGNPTPLASTSSSEIVSHDR